MRLFTATVLDNEDIMPSTHVLTLRAPGAGQGAAPGQFLHIRCGDGLVPLLRRPMSVYRAEGDVLQIVLHVVGQGSRRLAQAKRGDELDCLGPLGRGFHMDARTRHLLLVGRGHGIAQLAGLAERAIRRRVSVTLAVGASTDALVFPPALLPEEVEYLVATDDGSAGHHGSVTELVPDRLSWADTVCAAGPRTMLATLAHTMRDLAPRTPGQVALEERMACGTGACLSCAVETRGGVQRVCTEGPVLPIADVVWREEQQGAAA